MARTRILMVLGLIACLAAGRAGADTGEQFMLRGYRGVRHSVEARGVGALAVSVHHFSFDDPQRAVWFTSKLYSDFELTQGNAVTALTTPAGPVDALQVAGEGLIVPVLASGSRELVVLVGSAAGVAAQLAGVVKAAPLREAQLTHPLYMDKWDRYCLGVWSRIGDWAEDSKRPDIDSYYQWMGQIGLNPQVNMDNEPDDLASNDNAFTWLRLYLTKYNVKWQRVNWLLNQPDIYNRNPFLSKTANPHVATKWSYYGEVREGVLALRDAQTANFLTDLRPLAADPNQMAILDPDGEIGPYDMCWYGASGPVMQREFARFLREVRKLSLEDVSRRYYGKAGALKSWEDLPLVDWRRFYGWTNGAVDLAGEWRFMRDEQLAGYAQGWALPTYDDSDWVRLSYPGDELVYSLATNDRPLWMRKTVTIPPTLTGTIYLSVAPLSMNTVQVFLNGRPLGSLDRNYFTSKTFGQFDITADVAKSRTLTVTMRFVAGDTPNGPVFLTSKQMEDFPTSDPLLNAWRWDHMEFVDWAAAQGVSTTLSAIRSVDPDRPLKIHAYDNSPWGWKTVADYGGYSHHTGAGPGWSYFQPKEEGAAYNLQDSAETGGPVDNLRDLKGLFGNLVFMGKNAHDYFISMLSITHDPAMRAFFEAKIPAIKVMGRANVTISPIALINGMVNWLYTSEFAHSEIWRFEGLPLRGGELTPYLDEVRIRQGNLGRFRAIVDAGTQCWDEQMTAALQAYVQNGGILLLNNLSGEDSFISRGEGTGPGPTLAGVREGGVPPDSQIVTWTGTDANFPGVTGALRVWGRYGVPSRSLVPQAGTAVLGTWADGTPALTRRVIGKGVIYYCGGSGFPYDALKALTAQYGPGIYASAQGGVDEVRTLQSNNGCEDLLEVRGLGNKPVTVTWNFDYPPTGIYDPVTGQAVDAQIAGNTATFTVTIPDWDFDWFASRRPSPGDDFSHWFTRQTQIWSGFTTDAKAPEVPIFRHLDLNHGWKLAQTDSLDAAKALLPLDDAAAQLQPTELVLWDAPGMGLKSGPDVAGLYRKDFTLPAFWQKDSTFSLEIRGEIHDCPIHGWKGKSAIYLNGKSIWEGDRLDQAHLDVTSGILPAGRNRLEIVIQGNGIMPSIMLQRSAVPASVQDLAGTWQAVTGLNGEAPVTLPGTIQAAFVYQDVTIPASARGQEVWLRVDGRTPFAIINGKLRYWYMWGVNSYADSPLLELDITPDVRFGQSNRIVMGTGSIDGNVESHLSVWQPQQLTYKVMQLAYYRPGQWSADGKGTRTALTGKELAQVARDLGVVQPYDLVHPAVAKPAPVLVPAGTETQPPTLPPVLLDLDLHPASGPVVDRGPNHLAVTVKGDVTPMTEMGGKITGVYMHGESATPSVILVGKSDGVLYHRLSGHSATFRVWVKPMAINRNGGVLADWISYNFDWEIRDTNTTFSLSDPPSTERRLNAGSVIRQRAWQCLTLVIDGVNATLYVDGVPVGVQSWNKPIPSVDAPFSIGSSQGIGEWINAKLGAFTIYEGAMKAEDVARLYLQERAPYAPDPAAAGPEEDIFRLAIGDQGAYDAAEIPAQIETGPNVTVQHDERGPYLNFTGQKSYLLLRDHPRAKHFATPYSIIWEMRRAEGSSGMIWRHYHINCLSLEKDGTLIFDANIGHNNRVNFPAALPAGRWVRMMLTYDAHTVRLWRDGQLVAEKNYPGILMGHDFPTSVFCDNTYRFPDWGNIQGDLRELRIVGKVLPGMPAD